MSEAIEKLKDKADSLECDKDIINREIRGIYKEIEMLEQPNKLTDKMILNSRRCPVCSGRGYILSQLNNRCGTCQGSGVRQ